MIVKKKIIILLGPPGAGKGTISQALQENNIQYKHVSLGAICRIYSKEDTSLGIKIKTAIDKGNLIDDDLVEMIMNKIFNDFQEFDQLDNVIFILDGFPRTFNQAKIFLFLYQKFSMVFDFFVFLINLKESILRDRLVSRYICSNAKCDKIYSCQNEKIIDACKACNALLYKRNDDAIEVIQYRLDLYQKEIGKIIDYFNQYNIEILSLDGDKNIEHILFDINKMIVLNNPIHSALVN
jgi:adenylate kinase